MILQSPSLSMNGYGPIIISAIISAVIVIPVLGYKDATAIISFIILYFIIYVIIVSLSSENLANEIPTTLYPSEPHLGLDGISLNNYIAGSTN